MCQSLVTERHTPSYAHGVRDRETIDAEPPGRRAATRRRDGLLTVSDSHALVVGADGSNTTRAPLGIVASRMPMRERTYVCEPFLRYLPG
jgi:hypothetical protein